MKLSRFRSYTFWKINVFWASISGKRHDSLPNIRLIIGKIVVITCHFQELKIFVLFVNKKQTILRSFSLTIWLRSKQIKILVGKFQFKFESKIYRYSSLCFSNLIFRRKHRLHLSRPKNGFSRTVSQRFDGNSKLT